jgi:small subunit ribosomal protein S20
MPNTKSAERRARNSARKNLRNRSTKSSLHTLERAYLELLSAGKKEDAAKHMRLLSSALDKAVKSGVVHRVTANRKKSRLALRLARAK